jgi:ribose transport system permease protein
LAARPLRRACSALLLLIAFNLAFTPRFATMQTLSVNLTQVCTIVIVGVGMTLVIATGGIDLSVGALMAIAGAAAPSIFMGTMFPSRTFMSGLRWALPSRSQWQACSAFSTGS